MPAKWLGLRREMVDVGSCLVLFGRDVSVKGKQTEARVLSSVNWSEVCSGLKQSEGMSGEHYLS